jgi:AsmA protein
VRRRTILFGVGGFVAFLVVGAAATLLLVDANAYKARFEAAASQALGMQVSIGGRLGIAFFPGLLATLDDVHVHNRGLEIASAKQARFAIELLPLLSRQVRIRSIELKSATIAIERDSRGLLNLKPPDSVGAALPALDWPSVSLSDATLVYTDKQAGDAVRATACAIVLHRLRYSGEKPSSLLKGLAFTAELSCAQVLSGGFNVSDLTLTADANNGVLDLNPITTRVFGTQGTGRVHAEFSGAVPAYQVHYSLLQFPVEEFFRATSREDVASGRMDFLADLSMQGHSGKAMRQSAKGQVSLRGERLTIVGSDLDQQFSRFESSQTFNLVDVGAVFFAGPLGLVVTKGFDFANLLQKSGGRSEIRTLVSVWKVEHGVAHAQDVAMATRQNRVAMQGGLDFVNNQFIDVSVALIDAKGCPRLLQKVHGSFQNPVVEKPNLLASLAGPALRLLKKGRELLGDDRCDVFYAGTVAAPK